MLIIFIYPGGVMASSSAVLYLERHNLWNERETARSKAISFLYMEYQHQKRASMVNPLRKFYAQ